MKSKKMDRKLYWLYLRMLGGDKKLALKEYISFYEEYNKLISRIENNPNVPHEVLNRVNGDLKIPKYLQWIKQYLS